MKIAKSQLKKIIKEEIESVLGEAKTFRHAADQAQKEYLQSLDGKQKKMLARYRELERTNVKTPEEGQAVDSEMEDLRKRGVEQILQTLVDIRAEKTKNRKPYKMNPGDSRTGFIGGTGDRGTGYSIPGVSEVLKLERAIKEELEVIMAEGLLDKFLNRVSGADKLPNDVIVKHWPDGNRDRPPKIHSVRDSKNPRKFQLGPITMTAEPPKGLNIQFNGDPARIGNMYSDETGLYQIDRNTDI